MFTFPFFLGILTLLLIQGLLWSIWTTSKLLKLSKTVELNDSDTQAVIAQLHRDQQAIAEDFRIALQRHTEQSYRDAEQLLKEALSADKAQKD